MERRSAASWLAWAAPLFLRRLFFKAGRSLQGESTQCRFNKRMFIPPRLRSRRSTFKVPNRLISTSVKQHLQNIGLSEIDRCCIHERCESVVIHHIDGYTSFDKARDNRGPVCDCRPMEQIDSGTFNDSRIRTRGN